MAGEPTLRMGDRSNGEWVNHLRQSLNYYYQQDFLAADGGFDAHVQEAVRDFQQHNGLTADGVVGPRTWAALTDAAQRGQAGDDGHEGGRQGAGQHAGHHDGGQHAGHHDGGQDGHQVDPSHYPLLAHLHQEGEGYLRHFFDEQLDDHDDEHATHLSVTALESGRCADEYRDFTIAWAAFIGTAQQFFENASVGSAIAMMAALTAAVNAYLRLKECLGGRPEHVIAQLDEVFEHLQAEAEQAQAQFSADHHG
jgi:hypothetical protein